VDVSKPIKNQIAVEPEMVETGNKIYDTQFSSKSPQFKDIRANQHLVILLSKEGNVY